AAASSRRDVLPHALHHESTLRLDLPALRGYARSYFRSLFFFKQKTAYEIGLGIPAEPLFRSFHAVHFMRTLPTGSVDPNFGRRVRNRRQLNSLQNTWPYGYSMPIAVRYTQDAFSRSGWLWPVDAKGEPLKATSYMAVGFY